MTTIDENAAAATVGEAIELDETRHDYLRILDAIQSGALRLLSGFPQQPKALRIQVGEVTVEAQWPEGSIGTAVPATNISEPKPVSEPPPTAPAIRAPSVGVFYRSPEPGAEPFVVVGDRVAAGQQVAIVEAMKLMIPVTATASGLITEIHRQDCEPVQFDDPLFSYASE